MTICKSCKVQYEGSSIKCDDCLRNRIYKSDYNKGVCMKREKNEINNIYNYFNPDKLIKVNNDLNVKM